MAASLHALGSSFPATGQASSSLLAACGKAPGIACRLVWDLSHNSRATDITVVYLAGPIRLALRIALVLIIALLVRAAAGRLIRRITARTTISQDRSERGRGVFRERRSERATAIASLLGNAASVTIFTVAGLIILGDIGLNLAPVLASAGVLGVAIGFGAQGLVQDFLAGIFILLEDQYGVGDVIDVNAVSGTVEAVSLRVTRLRDVDGVAWTIRNGSITQAGNETHIWARAVIDLPLPYGVPVAAAKAALGRTAAAMAREPRWRGEFLDAPEVWGVQAVSKDVVLIRVAARTPPQARPEVTRELTERLMNALNAEQETAAALLATSIPRQPGPAEGLAAPETADQEPGALAEPEPEPGAPPAEAEPGAPADPAPAP